MKDKRLLKLVHNIIPLSFDRSGNLNKSNVGKIVKSLKSLPDSKAIFALTQYLKLLKNESIKNTIVVESAQQLSSSDLKKISNLVNKKLTIENIIDPSLLGGIKIKIGDVVYDNSLKNKIDQLNGAISSYE